MMNHYIENENKVNDPAQRLGRSMFNLSEKIEIPVQANKPDANAYERSMMSLYEKNQAKESAPEFTTVRAESSILNIQIPELNYEASEIELNQEEIEFFKLMNNALVFNNLKEDVKLMATGGWVRDKHLNHACHDSCASNKISVVFTSEKEGVTASSIAGMVQSY